METNKTKKYIGKIRNLTTVDLSKYQLPYQKLKTLYLQQKYTQLGGYTSMSYYKNITFAPALSGNWTINDIIENIQIETEKIKNYIQKFGNESKIKIIFFTKISNDTYNKILSVPNLNFKLKKISSCFKKLVHYYENNKHWEDILNHYMTVLSSNIDGFNITSDENIKKSINKSENLFIYDDSIGCIFSVIVLIQLARFLSENEIVPLLNCFESEGELSKCRYANIGMYAAGIAELKLFELGSIVLFASGNLIQCYADKGINSIQSTMKIVDRFKYNDVIIVSAGMEAILPTLVSLLVYKPVLAIPSSAGYGVGKDGISSFNSIYNSDIVGIGIFNIDNIFGACVCASLICNLRKNIQKANNEINYTDYNNVTDDDIIAFPTYITSLNTNEQIKYKKYNARYYENIFSENAITQMNAYNDAINGIKQIVPYLNLNNFDKEHIKETIRSLRLKYKYFFIDNYNKYYNDLVSILKEDGFTMSEIKYGSLDKKLMYITSPGSFDITFERLCQSKSKFYYTSKPVCILSTSVKDRNLAELCNFYLGVCGIKSEIISDVEYEKVLFYKDIVDYINKFDIILVIVKEPGLMPNLIGAVTENKIIIVLPNLDNDQNISIILQNCVAGIVTVNNKNFMSAVSLISSMLLIKIPDIELLFSYTKYSRRDSTKSYYEKMGNNMDII